MKKIGFLMLGLMLPLAGSAQEVKDDFSEFMKEQLNDFDKFLDDANKDFINFMRDPWKEFQAEKPVEKRVKPEPVKPVVFDEKNAPDLPESVCLTIEEILDLTTGEGKQKPVVKVKDVDDITFDKPEVITKKKDPTVIIVEEKVKEEPVAKPEKKAEPKKEPEPKKEADPQPEAKPEKKKPVVVVEPAEEPSVVETPKPVVEKPAPAEPAKPTAQPEKKTTPKSPLYTGGAGRMALSYGGNTYYVSDVLKGKCTLSSLKENAVANAYEAMCRTNYKPLLQDCAQVKADLQLNDWGVFTLAKALSDLCCRNENESVVMQQFLLNEMGYKAKMARKADANQMLLFVATDCTIYGHPYTQMNGLTYYNINGNKPCAFYMCQMDSPNAKNRLTMELKNAPNLEGSTARSTHRAKGNSASVTVDVPKALMDFYKSYPQCDYGVYAKAPVNKAVEETLLASLAPLVQGKSEKDAANILINFVQTGFEYATDDEQFGYEKPFFVEELFYYPYCDCEDRSILYAYLVRKLIGLDVVYLDYPDHIATAVRFNGNVGGDYLMVNGQKYTVCDPTYIGASIGMTMPQYKSVAAKVLRY